MKVSMAALSFLILAVALGSQSQVINDTETLTLLRPEFQLDTSTIHKVFHQPADCCFSYTRRIRCSNIKDYFVTSSGCAQPGIIFVTKKGQQFCANPKDLSVQECMKKLKDAPKSTN